MRAKKQPIVVDESSLHNPPQLEWPNPGLHGSKVNDLNIESQFTLLTPEALKKRLPIPVEAADFVAQSRQTIMDILSGKDPRKLVVVGPCSIHDIQSAKDYATRLKKLSAELGDELFIVMRVYFEKPRTTVGWKGLINDPHLNDSFNVETGLTIARALLLWLAELNMPTATEMLDPMVPQYLSDLIAWSAIGARTAESQTHRELASGLSMPVGFKNGTDGSASVAINAMKAASSPHRFIGINQQGQVSLFQTRGNANAHIILRGGLTPNYRAKEVAAYESRLAEAGLPLRIMVDCSHGNSQKNHRRQVEVLNDVMEQIVHGNQSIIGFMLESHLNEGSQPILDRNDLAYGVSITDACIDFKTTAAILRQCADQLNELDLQRQALKMGVSF